MLQVAGAKKYETRLVLESFFWDGGGDSSGKFVPEFQKPGELMTPRKEVV